MNYVNCWHNKTTDIIHVVGRDKDGNRVFNTHPVQYSFYVEDHNGKHKSIYGDAVRKVTCKNLKDFKMARSAYATKQLFETDLNPIFTCLSEYYANLPTPKLNVCFFDIETDFQPYAFPSGFKLRITPPDKDITVRELGLLPHRERYKVYDHIDKKWVQANTCRYIEAGPGYAASQEAFLPITAISVHLQWSDALICLALIPSSLTEEAAAELIKDIPNTYLFTSEKEMLLTFLDLIEDVDVLSAWNGEGFDIPYVVNRITRILSKEYTKKLCLFDQFPKKREYEKYGRTAFTYDLVGRMHIDSLELYRKYTYEERHSYKLDAIAEYELHERKTVYEGTLDQLYHDDFAKFVEYNRQDCALLNKLDNKLKFIDIANEVAHEIGVLIPTTMGVVSATDQAIINEAHKLGFCIKDRVRTKDLDTQAAGAYVAYPKKGLHDWVGLLDVKSLYPSVIRAMNMSPETIVGQLRQTDTENFIQNKIENGTSFATAWEGLFGSLEFTAVLEKDKGKMITVDWENGTTDTLSGAEIHELIYNSNQPYMLSANGTIFTYSKEGVIPGILTKWYSDRQTYQKNLQEAIEKKDKVAEEHWDKRQQVTKIQLNSLYGALLNAGSRFFDKRLGQSVTLTGRQVVKHMSAKVNEIITGFYDYKGESVKYNDSVTGDTMIRTDGGQIPIKELYEQCCQHVIEYGKEYGVQSFAKVVGFNAFEDSPVMSTISYVMRHKTKKKLYKITLQNDKSVTVTEDHSVMVDRAGFLLEVTPLEIKDTDLIICLNT